MTKPANRKQLLVNAIKKLSATGIQTSQVEPLLRAYRLGYAGKRAHLGVQGMATTLYMVGVKERAQELRQTGPNATKPKS